jgi:hypothetical protein
MIRPRAIRAVALACAAEHAPRLAYAAGGQPAQRAHHAHRHRLSPVPSARLHRPRAAPIGRDIMPDDTNRSATPLGLAEG